MFNKELAKLLDLKGLGTFDETGISGDIFINGMPTSPDICMAIYNSSSEPPNPKLGYDKLKFQILVRGTKNPATAELLATNVYNEIHAMSGIKLGDYYVVDCLSLQSGPAWIGKDESQRHEFSLNFIFDVVNKSNGRE